MNVSRILILSLSLSIGLVACQKSSEPLPTAEVSGLPDSIVLLETFAKPAGD